MNDKDEMMSRFEDFKNSRSAFTSLPKREVKDNEVSVSKPKVIREIPKELKERKVFVTQSRKELQPLERGELKIENESRVLESDSRTRKISISSKESDTNQEKVTEHTRREKKLEERKFNRQFKDADMPVREIAKKESNKNSKQYKRITPPKERGFWERLANIIYLNEHEYDIYKEDIEDYKKGKISKEDIELVWEEIQEYEDAKSDIKLRTAWRNFKLALVGIGLTAFVGFGKQVVDYSLDFANSFWDDTKKALEEHRETYELINGDYFPNGEKKRKLTLEEYEQLTEEQRKHIMYVPSINAELVEEEDGSMTVFLPEESGKKTADATQDNSTKDLER